MIHPKIRIILFIMISLLIGMLQSASASGNDIIELKERLSSFDDPKITVQDLAFFLMTHNFDAKPTGNGVELDLDGTIYKLVPNGNKPGLCDISPAIP
ncbi:MAG: hypothetical protein A4E49_01544 [Methanosaeta sp. PtaU1.Bin112]|nr:MAG: hypothetical protein A4E49_01544 [Methanosaeta sp. PtaU1.Bin112]